MVATAAAAIVPARAIVKLQTRLYYEIVRSFFGIIHTTIMITVMERRYARHTAEASLPEFSL